MTLRSHRTPPSEWQKVFNATQSSLLKNGATNIILFGSQAMSAYLERALSSKDLDLIVEGVSIRMLKQLSEDLGVHSGSQPSYDYSVSDYLGREYPVAHFYLKPNDGRPFVVELFYNFLGYDAKRLNNYLSYRKCWGTDTQVPTPEAIVATRLAFRPPERITPFNAKRLNLFIEKSVARINWRLVNEFILDFKLQKLVADNLDELKKKHNLNIRDSNKLVVSEYG